MNKRQKFERKISSNLKRKGINSEWGFNNLVLFDDKSKMTLNVRFKDNNYFSYIDDCTNFLINVFKNTGKGYCEKSYNPPKEKTKFKWDNEIAYI